VLPNTKYLRQFSAKDILGIFALGRVEYLPDGNLRNNVTREPGYHVKLLNTGTFVLEALANRIDLSVDFISDVARHCMKDTTEWEEEGGFIIARQGRENKGQWGYRGQSSKGFELFEGTKYDNCSKAGFKELQAKYDGRTDGPTPHSRYPKGHPVGDLLMHDPGKMKRDMYYWTKGTTREEGQEYNKKIIDKHREEIEASGSNNDQKFDANLECCHDLFLTHRLGDGHTRIFAGFIFNFLQLKHGLPPSIIEGGEDKLFAIFSREETRDIAVKGRSRLMPHEETSTL